METPLPSEDGSLESISHHLPSESDSASSIGSLPIIPESVSTSLYLLTFNSVKSPTAFIARM